MSYTTRRSKPSAIGPVLAAITLSATSLLALPPELSQTTFTSPGLTPSPTCLSAHPNGDLFVGVDMCGSLGKGPGKGKIVRLRDTDNDGVIDQLDFYPKDITRSRFGGQKALIVAGGGPYPTNFLWSATKNMANYAYTALRFQGLTDDEITYLSEEPRPEVDGVPTIESIVDAILELIVILILSSLT